MSTHDAISNPHRSLSRKELPLTLRVSPLMASTNPAMVTSAASQMEAAGAGPIKADPWAAGTGLASADKPCLWVSDISDIVKQVVLVEGQKAVLGRYIPTGSRRPAMVTHWGAFTLTSVWMDLQVPTTSKPGVCGVSAGLSPCTSSSGRSP